MEKKKRSYAVLVVYVILLVLTLTLVLKFGASPGKEVEKIGFITTGDISDAGWSAINYQGAKSACDALGVELVVMSEIPEFDGSCPQAVAELADQGVGMIILNSRGYAQEMEDYLDQYSNIAFYGAGSDINAANLSSYSSRLYQARYLSGIVAGMQTKTGKIGFVAADKKTEVYRGINAFALGVRRVNPTAEVVVTWTGSWDDREKEMDLTKTLIEKEGVDVVTYHQDHPNVIEEAEKTDICSIGYYEPIKNGSERYLTCAMCDWAPLYERLIRAYLRGQGNNEKFDWLGLDSGVIILTEYSPLVSEKVKDEVQRATQEILSGQDVFTGEIYDNQGIQRCGEGEAMGDETLLYDMEWLAEGVREYEN